MIRLLYTRATGNQAPRWLASISHLFVGIGMQAIAGGLALALGAPWRWALWIGCAFATGGYLMREVTQDQYRKKEGRSTATVWWIFLPRTVYGWVEFLVPAIATCLIAWLFG